MDAASLHGWWTVVLLLAFVGIVVWAWSARRKTDFDAAARIPLEDDGANGVDREREENERG